MKKVLSIVLSIIILTLSLSAGISAFAADAAVKYDAQKQQHNAQVASFNYSGDKTVKLIYDFNADNYKVYYSQKLTKKGKAIFTVSDITSLYIKGKYVYYADSAKGGIFRRRLDGKKVKTIVKFKKNKYSVRFIIVGSRLIYNLYEYTQDEAFLKTKLYVSNVKGTDKKLIAKNVKSDFYMYKNMLYFIKDKELMRYDFKEGELKKRNVGLDLTGAELAGMENNILYVNYIKGDLDNICNFYRVDVENQKYWKYQSVEVKAPIHNATIYENKPYIVTGTSPVTEFAAVRGDEADYKSYRKKYTAGGDSLGFLKNSIVLDNHKYSEKRENFVFNKYVVMVK